MKMRAVLLNIVVALSATAFGSEVPFMDAWSSLAVMEPYDAVTGTSSVSHNRTKRQLEGLLNGLSLSVPAGAIIALAPRFGWLLYQDPVDDEEELDLVFETEFLYRFPEEEEEEEEEEEHEGRENEEESSESEEEERRRGWMRHSKHFSNHGSNHGFNHRSNHRSNHGSNHRFNVASYDGINGKNRFLLHRNKRMVRDKKLVYTGFENVFNIMGLDGRACLLRAICEVTATPLVYDGIVGELLNMALVPRHTNGHHADLSRFLEAEEHGRLGSDCGAVYPACPISLFQKVAPASVHFE